MIKSLVQVLHENPQILVFLALAMGYFLGKKKIFGISLGPTTCVLLSALVLGQIGVKIPAILKNISFALFTFCIGYKVGPQFFGALKKEGLNYIWISLIVAFVSLATAIFLGKVFHLDQGTTAGLFAGAVTQSAAIGTAEGAIRHLAITDAQKTILEGNVAVAYAITYIFGTAGTLIFIKMVPGFWKINLKDKAKDLEKEMGGTTGLNEDSGFFPWSQQLDFRAYKVTSSAVIGKTVSQLEASFLPGRLAVKKIKREEKILDFDPGTEVHKDDVLLMLARSHEFLNAPRLIGPEADKREATDLIGEVLKICALNPRFVGMTIGQLSRMDEAHGLFLRRIMRQGHELPIVRDTVVQKCDVLQVIGEKSDVERAAKSLGYPERPTAVTDLVMVGAGCMCGTFLGLVAIPVAGIPLTLGLGGGVLVAGLFAGWLRSLHPTFGRIPSGAQWILTDLGLNLFIACVGLAAGAQAIKAFETTGLTVFLGGAVLSLLPMIAALIVGKSVLKMDPVLLLGAVSGARVFTAGLNMLQEEAASTTPVLGYAAPYAFGNVLLTIWGSVLVYVM